MLVSRSDLSATFSLLDEVCSVLQTQSHANYLPDGLLPGAQIVAISHGHGCD